MKKSTDFSFLKRTVNDKTINLENFFEFLMADMDGELDDPSRNALETFMQLNPHLEREASLFRKTLIVPDHTVTFPSPDLLKRRIVVNHETLQTNVVDEILIASLEGDLSAREEQMLHDKLLSDADLLKRYNQFESVRLSPDLAVKYPDRSSLKKRSFVPIFSRRVVVSAISVAASFLLVLGLWLSAPSPEANPALPDVVVVSQAGRIQPVRLMPDPIKTSATESSRTVRVAKRVIMDHAQIKEDPEPSSYVYPSVSFPQKQVPLLVASVASSTTEVEPPMADHEFLFASTENGYSGKPSGNRLTVEAFNIEKIRYFTGGGNERPGLLSDISLSGIAEATNTHQIINAAGQNLYAQWSDLKYRVLSEVALNR